MSTDHQAWIRCGGRYRATSETVLQNDWRFVHRSSPAVSECSVVPRWTESDERIGVHDLKMARTAIKMPSQTSSELPPPARLRIGDIQMPTQKTQIVDAKRLGKFSRRGFVATASAAAVGG